MSRTPDVGSPAPDFELASTRGSIRLKDRLVESEVLLVFYPGDDTTVCTRQLCDYRDNLAVFSELGVDVMGVNHQPMDSHERFARKHSLPFPLLSDPDRSVCRAYGATGLLGTTRRTLVLIGRDGRVRWRHDDLPIFRRSAAELRGILSGLA